MEKFTYNYEPVHKTEDLEDLNTRKKDFRFLSVIYRLSLIALKISLILFGIFFLVIPIIFKYSTSFQRTFIFLNSVNWASNLDNPEELSISGARNLYIKYHSNISKQDIKLGVWHLLPHKLKNWKSEAENKSRDEIFDTHLANSEHPVVLYAHGNARCRATGHRLELYDIFQKLNYHVIAFDYRSYGDSTSVPLTEVGVVEDTLMVYKWLLKKVNKENAQKKQVPIYIWGHSLGTGISTHCFAIIGLEMYSPVITNKEDIEVPLRQPNGIFLESPFNNLVDEMKVHFLANIFNWLPWYDWVIDGIKDSNLTFYSDKYIPYITSPIMIMHAEDDLVIPYKLGRKLYEDTSKLRNPEYGQIEFVTFNRSEGLGHKYICRSKQIPELISNFVQKYNATEPLILKSTNMPEIIMRDERKSILSNVFYDE